MSIAKAAAIDAIESARSTPMHSIRALTREDSPTLWTMLMHAAHESSVATIQANPDLARYVKGWGRAGDMGRLAEQAGASIGAAWLRLWSADDHGYGYLAEDIPELAIALIPAARAQGIGTALLTQTLAMASNEFSAVCLSIRADNPALRLYQRVGFVPVAGTEVTNRVGSVSFTMLYQYDSSKTVGRLR
jgi:ribosomal protein S18 acetylase RimI-like enzyme